MLNRSRENHISPETYEQTDGRIDRRTDRRTFGRVALLLKIFEQNYRINNIDLFAELFKYLYKSV